MKKSTVLKNIMLSYDSLMKTFDAIDPEIDFDDKLMDKEVDVDLYVALNDVLEIIKKVDLKSYNKLVKERVVAG